MVDVSFTAFSLYKLFYFQLQLTLNHEDGDSLIFMIMNSWYCSSLQHTKFAMCAGWLTK